MKINKLPRKKAQRNLVHDKRYDTRRWRRMRKQCLEDAQYKCQCFECSQPNAPIKVANTADHPIPVTQGGSFWDQKLTAMSESCHAKKSARERRNLK